MGNQICFCIMGYNKYFEIINFSLIFWKLLLKNYFKDQMERDKRKSITFLKQMPLSKKLGKYKYV